MSKERILPMARLIAMWAEGKASGHGRGLGCGGQQDSDTQGMGLSSLIAVVVSMGQGYLSSLCLYSTQHCDFC